MGQYKDYIRLHLVFRRHWRRRRLHVCWFCWLL